ncbi:MAG: hypothetical protein VW683_03315 [Betaproteobacteria bacterium]
MSENFDEDLQRFEELSAALEPSDADEKGMHMDEVRKGAPSVFMTDIRFKEALETGDLLSEEAFADLDEDDQKSYELVEILDEKGEEPMGWAYRFKADDIEGVEEEGLEVEEKSETDEDAEVPEEKSDEAEEPEEKTEDVEATEEKVDDMPAPVAEDLLSKRAADILARMRAPMEEAVEEEEEKAPSIFLTDIRFKEMVEDGELIEEEEFASLDEDAKGAFQAVDVFEEGTGKGYGMRYRRRSPMEVSAMRKGGHETGEKAAHDGDASEDMFDSAEGAEARAAELGCVGTHRAGDMWMPCATHDEWMELSAAAKPDEPEAAPAAPPAAPAPAAQAAAGGMAMPAKEEFLCGYQRKSVSESCGFCTGGCASQDGLPGLADIEAQVKEAYLNSEIIGSGYSSNDDVFVVDVKREDGSLIEVFLTGDGDELGWLRLNESALESKSAEPVDIISKATAEKLALDAVDQLGFKAEAMSITVDVYADQDVYVVEADSEEKSFDVFVSAEGKVLGYDEYSYSEPVELSEEDEIKALEAELAIKRLYSREQREEMAASGEALEDGSFPIADEADLANAVQAFGRASDPDSAKEHIMKRAKELKREDMIPEDWNTPTEEDMEAEPADAPGGGEKVADDVELLRSLLEFEELEGDLS